MSRYFGTNGVRGKFDFLNPELALKLAQAIGVYLGKGKIVVGRDARLTGETLSYAVISGLESVGSEVIDLGMAASPTIEYMIKVLKANGAVIITASHNPPEWNALKVVDRYGVAVSREDGEKIEKILDAGVKNAEWNDVLPKQTNLSATREHIEGIKKEVDTAKIKNKKPKLVLDCANNTPALIAPTLFKELGCNVILINDKIDGRFPGRPSEPTKENVKELIARVKKEKADAGIAWDGDGDRVIFIDENGKYIIGDRVFAFSLLAYLEKSKTRGRVVTTVATSAAVEEIAKRFGCSVSYTRVGAPYLSANILSAASETIMGGEEVGGVIFPKFSLAKDGFLTAAKMVEAICTKPLSRWMEEVPLYYNEKIKIDCNEDQKKKVIAAIRSYAIRNRLNFIDIDGVRINFEDGWVIVRPSGTENYLRIFAEAKEKEKASSLLKQYEKLVKEFI